MADCRRVAVVTGQAPGPPQNVDLYHCEFHIFGAFQTVVKQIHFILTCQYIQGAQSVQLLIATTVQVSVIGKKKKICSNICFSSCFHTSFTRTQKHFPSQIIELNSTDPNLHRQEGHSESLKFTDLIKSTNVLFEENQWTTVHSGVGQGSSLNTRLLCQRRFGFMPSGKWG